MPLLLRATEAEPGQARMWAALGVAYAAQGLYDLAEPPFGRACGIDPKLEDACYYQGRALYALDRFEASVEVLRRVSPGTWKIHLAIAQALEAMGRAGESEREFRAALSLAQNNDPQPGVAFGLFLVRQGRLTEAAGPLDEVLKRFPACADAHLYLGRALLEQEKAAASIPHLERAVELQSGSAQAHLLLAKAYVRSGRSADAEPHFQAAARLDQLAR